MVYSCSFSFFWPSCPAPSPEPFDQIFLFRRSVFNDIPISLLKIVAKLRNIKSSGPHSLQLSLSPLPIYFQESCVLCFSNSLPFLLLVILWPFFSGGSTKVFHASTFFSKCRPSGHRPIDARTVPSRFPRCMDPNCTAISPLQSSRLYSFFFSMRNLPLFVF